MRLLSGFLIFLLLALPAAAATVVAVPTADSVVLDSGETVRLYGIIAPPSAQDYLKQLAMGQVVALETAKQSPDRYGDVRGVVLLQSGKSLQQEMVANGRAQVLALPGDEKIVNELLPLERAAHAGGKGLWNAERGGTVFAIATPDTAAQATGRFGLMQGRVTDVAVLRDIAYVNFGADYKTDFTLSMAPKIAKNLKVKDWVGKTVLARGWISEQNGPMITVTSPLQAELVD